MALKRNSPAPSLKQRTKLSYHPQYESEFRGQSSPKPSKYNPNLSFVQKTDPKFTVQKEERFTTPSSVAVLRKNLPVQYTREVCSFNKDEIKKTSMGFGRRWQLKTEKEDEENPGPKYNDKSRTINKEISVLAAKRNSTFGEKDLKYYDHEQQRVLLGREAPGPGIYETPNKSVLSQTQNKSASHFPQVRNFSLFLRATEAC